MTLIAVLFADDCDPTGLPIVITDSMFSRDRIADDGLHTPLRAGPDQRPGMDQTYWPAGLTRKFLALPDRSLFLYAASDIDQANRCFMELSRRIDEGEVPTRELVMDVRHAMGRDADKFSCIVLRSRSLRAAVPDLSVIRPHVCDAFGDIEAAELEGYGYLLVGGSAKKNFIRLLSERPSPPPGDVEAKVLAAMNAAAIASTDYRRNASQTAAASAGGYFEVVLPWLFESNFEAIVRGSAHVFVRVEEDGVFLERLVVARQNDSESVVLAGPDRLAHVQGNRVVFRLDEIESFLIDDTRPVPIRIQAPSGMPIAHIGMLTVIGHRELPCGHSVHAHVVHFSNKFPVATASLLDDSEPGEPESYALFLMESKSIERLFERLAKARCPRCSGQHRAEPTSDTSCQAT